MRDRRRWGVSRQLSGALAALLACSFAACEGEDDPESAPPNTNTNTNNDPSTTPRPDGAAPRPHHTKFVVACKGFQSCTEYLSDTGDPEMLKKSVMFNCTPQRSSSTYQAERCPTEDLVGRCLESTRVRFGLNTLDAKQEASLATHYYKPVTDENARGRCQDGMYESRGP